MTAAALEAARSRSATVERHQSVDHQALWADLLSSEALAFNLFGDLAADLDLADRAVHGLWPGTPGRVVEVRFLYSPGRLDPEWLNSLRQFDAAFLLDLEDGTRGILAVDTKYHERFQPETPKPENGWRYREVAKLSGIFGAGAVDELMGRGELAVLWLEHLLLHSMLQHPSEAWTWGLYVVVHSSGNASVEVAAADTRNCSGTGRRSGP